MTLADKRRENTEERLKRVNKEVTRSMKVFNQHIMEAVDIAEDSIIAFQHEIALELYRRIILKTPVDTGRARGNWLLDIDNDNMRKIERKIKRGSAGESRLIFDADSRIARKLKKIGMKIFISNNLEYISFLEDGSSKQAGLGMVKVSIAELQQKVVNA